MRFLTLAELLELHRRIIDQSGDHPFIDGNKRIGHAAMEVFLMLNGFELNASVGDSESVIMQLAASELERIPFVDWVIRHVVELES